MLNPFPLAGDYLKGIMHKNIKIKNILLTNDLNIFILNSKYYHSPMRMVFIAFGGISFRSIIMFIMGE